jgi:hypothetical protein
LQREIHLYCHQYGTIVSLLENIFIKGFLNKMKNFFIFGVFSFFCNYFKNQSKTNL